MSCKCEKTAENNQWISTTDHYPNTSSCHKRKKTAEDNEWCSCNKNGQDDK